jgi:ubiquinone/menaquinone biosynthesis C-methylase UbiE
MISRDLATDQEHLTTQMYADDQPLEVRIRIHELYTRPEMDFAAWVLDHVRWRGDETVLDIGCGSGLYFEPLCERLTRGGRLLCGDLSLGMLRDAAARVILPLVSLFNGDAMHLPLPNCSCDVVLANHMLYHVPQIERAVAEVHRVLRPGGRLLAATNARDSMRGFLDLVETALRTLGYRLEIPDSPVITRFNLDNGRPFIESLFPNVQMHQFQAALVFPAVEPIIAYVNSMSHTLSRLLPDGLAWEQVLAAIAEQVASTIRRQGEYPVSKTTGVFAAEKPGGSQPPPFTTSPDCGSHRRQTETILIGS